MIEDKEDRFVNCVDLLFWCMLYAYAYQKPLFPFKSQPVPARIRTFLLPTESGLDERIPPLHFAAG